MMIPFFFWDYNLDQHEYVISVLKQRAALAEEGYFPAEYDGSLSFTDPGETHGGVPTDPGRLLQSVNTHPKETVAAE